MDRRLFMLSLGMFALGTDSMVLAGVLPEISRGFNVSVGAAGQMTTVYAVTYAVLAPVIAAIAAGVPRKRLLLLGLLVFVIANLGTAYAPTFGIALATRALAGLGAAMFSPTATGAATMLVPPERRGYAISVVIAGMTISAALGSPVGTLLGGVANWHWTMVFVAALAGLAALGVATYLSEVPMPPPVSLGRRLAPLADSRVVLTLLTSLLFFTGVFSAYIYFAVVFKDVVGGNPVVLSALLVLWGISGTISNIAAGRVIDAMGSRQLLMFVLTVLCINFVLMPTASHSLWMAIPSVIVWGACGWCFLVPQQHRIVSIAPALAPIVLGLNNSATFLGMTFAGIVGAAGYRVMGPHNLGYISAALLLGTIVFAELAGRRITSVSEAQALSPGNPALAPASERARI